jgi:hypothetical protein
MAYDEVLSVPERSGCLLHLLDFGVDGFGRRVSDAVVQVLLFPV